MRMSKITLLLAVMLCLICIGAYAGPDRTPPTVPTNVAGTAVSMTQVNLTWTASTDNIGVTGYKIFRNAVQVGTSTTTSYSDTGLAAGTTYAYTVSAYDARSNNSAQSSPAVNVTTIADTQAPTVPTNVAGTAIAYNQVSLSWTASTDNLAVAGYKVYRNAVVVGSTASTTYNDGGLTENTTYAYTVSAYDAANNNSAQSSPAVNVTTPAAPPTPTSTPTGVTVSCDLGPTNTNNNMNETTPAVADGDTIGSTDFGRTDRYNSVTSSDLYIYFQISDTYVYQGNHPWCTVTFDYYDTTDSNLLRLQYDSPGTTIADYYKNAATQITTTGTNAWKTATIELTDAYFGNRENNGSDMRLNCSLNKRMYIDQISVFIHGATAPPPSFNLGPNLGKLTDTSVTVTFETNNGYIGTVAYGTVLGTYPNSVSDSAAATWHELTINGLTAGVTYYYQVTTTGGGPYTPSGDANYKIVTDGGETAFNFLAYGDSRTNTGPHQAVLDEMVATNQNDRFLIHDGDIIESDTLSVWYTQCFNLSKNVQRYLPWFTVSGNHEANGPNFYHFWALPTNSPVAEHYYSFNFGNVHVVGMNNYADNTALDTAQFNWLTSDLAANQKEHIILMQHAPMHSTATHGESTNSRNQVYPIAVTRNVTAIIGGHNHVYERSFPLVTGDVRNDTTGITFFCLGNGGAPFYTATSASWTAKFVNNQYGFMRIGVSGKTVSYNEIGTNGATIDSFTMTYQ